LKIAGFPNCSGALSLRLRAIALALRGPPLQMKLSHHPSPWQMGHDCPKIGIFRQSKKSPLPESHGAELRLRTS